MIKYLPYLIIVVLFGCKKEIGPQSVSNDEISAGKLLILNEGNFGFGNASVSVYDSKTKKISNNQYRAVNGVGIGDVLQSVNRYKDSYYFVVNNSGKVVVTDTNLVYQAEITGLNSPRYIEFYDNKAFVTDLKQKAIYVIDLSSNAIIKQINTQGWTEQISIHAAKLLVLDRGDYLSNSSPNYIYIINPITLIKEDSIQTAINPNSMVIDKNDKLWVLSSGKAGIENGKLIQYDVSSKLSLKSFTFPLSLNNPSRLVIDNQKQRLFYINTSIYSMVITDSSLPTSSFYAKATENFYGLYVESTTNEVYVADAKNYNQSGEILRINSQGRLIERYTAGIIPQYLY